jgi:ribonuclease D
MSAGRAELIQKSADFASLLGQLRREPLVAVDTEAASFHRHHDRVYLLQLSTRSGTWIVDPLEVTGLPGFDGLLADPGIEVIFHDADYDLRLLAREFGYRAHRIFDTRVAAQLLGETGIGLAALLEKYFQVRLDKRFQRADWSARPLTPEMLDYAATDTTYLPQLRDVLHQRLLQAGRLSWAEEEFSLLEEVRWPDPESPEVASLDVRGARALTPRALAVFRELYVWRYRKAEELDRAAFRITGNESLLALAQNPPGNVDALRQVRGLGRELRERYAEEILATIRRGLAIPEAELPRYRRSPRHRPDPGFELRLQKLKVVREAESARLQLAPGVLAPNWLLEEITRKAPGTREQLSEVAGLRRWQQEVLGDRILGALA